MAKNVNYEQLQQLANEVQGHDLNTLQQTFQDLEQAVAGLASVYEAQRATDLITQLKSIVNKVLSEVEPVCKEFGKVANEESDYWRKFATSQAQITQ